MSGISSLEYFKTVADTQNFTRAAQQLNISQPALSRIVRKLEDELGCKLFRAKGRGVELTTYGKIYLEYVSDALESLEAGKRKIQLLTAPKSGIVRISSLYTLSVNMLPYIIKDFKREYEMVKFQIFQQPTKIQMNMLRDDEIDICFCTDFVGFDEEYDFEKIIILIEDLFLLVNRSHRLAGRGSVALQELKDENFIFFSDLTYFKKPAMSLFEKVGIQPHIVYESNEDSAVAGFVAADMGIALIPPIMGVDFKKCVPLKISYPVCQRQLCMAWKKERMYSNPAAKNFRDFVIKWLPEDKKFSSPYYPT